MKTHNYFRNCFAFILSWMCASIFASPPPCTLTCPNGITTVAETDKCSAGVNYPAITSNCPVSVIPPSGSLFPVGTTTVKVFADGCNDFYALGAVNTLLSFNKNTPGIVTTVPITGVIAPEILRGIDFRPATGELFALGVTFNFGHIYTINLLTSVATPIGPGFPLMNNPPMVNNYGFDFNPTTDRIRIVSGPSESIRVNPNTGTIVAVDAPLNPAPHYNIHGVAYTNNYMGASSTTLYGIDNVTHTLVTIGGQNGVPSPNSGTIILVGPLGVASNPVSQNGFDISPCDNSAYAILDFGVPVLLSINLATGAATPIGPIGAPPPINGFAIRQSVPDCTFPVTVNDDQPPKLFCPGNIVVSINSPGQCGAFVGYAVNGTDNCTVPTITGVPASGSFFPNGTTTVTVTATDGSNNSAQCQFTVTVNGISPVPGPITGPTSVCKGQIAVYCVNPIPGADTYAWTLPPGTAGFSASNCITVSFNSHYEGGSICVAGVNQCGRGQASCKNLILAPKLGKPGPITGPASVCLPSTAVYCIPAVPFADSYSWIITGNGGPSPATITLGQGTTCVTVVFPAGYNGNQELKVRASNCKGLGDERKIDLKVKTVPPIPGNIAGPTSVCKSQLGFYSIGSVPTATNYLWTVNGNVFIAGGQGTTSIALDFLPSNTTSALLFVLAQNDCGFSTGRSTTIAINTACKLAEEETEKHLSEMTAIVYPNPTSGKTTIRFENSHASDVSLKVYDLTGRVMYHEVISSIEGVNEKDFDLGNLPKAVYIVRIEDENESRTIRLVLN